MTRRWRLAGAAGRCFPRTPSCGSAKGCLLHELGRLDEARQAYLDVLESRDERHFSSVDRGLYGFQGAAEPGGGRQRHGRPGRGRAAVARGRREVPRYRPGLARAGRDPDPCAAGSRRPNRSPTSSLSDDELRVEGLLIKSRAAQTQGRLAEAVTRSTGPIAECPDDPETLRRALPVPLRARDARRGRTGAQSA